MESNATPGQSRRIIGLLKTLHAVKAGADLRDWFKTVVSVQKGSLLSPLLLNNFLKILMTIAMSELDTEQS